MTVTVEKGQACGSVKAPPSKSIAHRMLICAALSSGSEISNIEYSEDVNATLSCLEALGANVERGKNRVLAGGLDVSHIKDGTVLDCNESGSTLRFMIPICLLSGKEITLKGSKRLFERPLGIYEDICRSQGIVFNKGADSLTLCGTLKPGDFSVPGNISSQFVSGLLFALPLLKGDSRITLTGSIESRSYIMLTLKALSDFGVKAEFSKNAISINGFQKYSSESLSVEGDFSNAAFLDALGLIGGNVEVTGLSDGSAQGDRVYKEMFSDLKNGRKKFDLSDCPDLAPIMFALAAVFGGAEFSGTERLKIKESDRAQAMKEELLKFGIQTEVFENTVSVKGGRLKTPDAVLSSHNDHRIVMALTVLSTLTGGVISGAQAVNKSYPGFFSAVKSLKIGIRQNEA